MSVKFEHMTQDEVVSHIENHGTDEQKTLLGILYVCVDEIIPNWDDCPECANTDNKIDKVRDTIVEALNVRDTIVEALEEL